MDTNVSIDFSKPPDEGDAKLLFVLNGLSVNTSLVFLTTKLNINKSETVILNT